MAETNGQEREFEHIPVITPEVVQQMSGGAGVGDLIASGRTIEQIRSKYHTAVRVQVARDLDSVKKRCIQEAKHGGDEFGWAWPVEVPIKDEKGQIQKDANGKWLMKKEIIDGPGVHLMMAAARNWGNCTTELYVTADTPDRYDVMGVFVDFETGYTNMRPYTIRKSSRALSDKQKSRPDQVARQEDMTLQIGLSKCIRNVIKGALPSWLIDAMYEESKKYSKEAIERKLPDAIEKAVFTFGKYGVTAEQIEVLLECPRARWTADHIIKLRGILQGIKDGDMTIAEAFPQTKQAATTAEGTSPQSQSASTPPAPEPDRTPAATPAAEATAEPKLDPDTENKITEVIGRLNEIAAGEPSKRAHYINSWTQGKLKAITDLKRHPELVDHALEVSRMDCRDEGVVWPPQNQPQGKIL